MGGLSKMTTALCDEIVQRLSEGQPLAHICRDEHMPGLRTVYDWMEADESFAARIAHARVAGHDVIATGTLAIADEPPPVDANGKTDAGFVAWQKNRIWTRMQLLAKWDPKRYGDKLELSGNKDAPLTVQVVRLGDSEKGD